MTNGRITVQIETDRVGIDVAGFMVVLTLDEAQWVRKYLNAERERLRPSKNWRECPYENHSDDCNCDGSAGDR